MPPTTTSTWRGCATSRPRAGVRREGNDEAQKADNGQGGAPSEATSQEGFEVYIPLESTEKPAGGDAGKAPPKERKG